MRYTLSDSQQAELRRCPHVKSCSARQIHFTPEFKRHVLKEYARGKAPSAIFRESGIPTPSGRYAKDVTRGWKQIAAAHGEKGFDEERRGRVGCANLARWRDKKKAYEAMSDREKIVYLEAQVEALEHVRSRFHLPPSLHSGTHGLGRRKNAES